MTVFLFSVRVAAFAQLAADHSETMTICHETRRRDVTTNDHGFVRPGRPPKRRRHAVRAMNAHIKNR